MRDLVYFANHMKLEIKPCVLGFRIREIEADFIYW